MAKNTTQEERLNYLVEEFKADSAGCEDLEIPKDTEEKRRILRSLMNMGNESHDGTGLCED